MQIKHYCMRLEFKLKQKFLKEIEDFYNLNLKKDFKILKPIKLINTIRWKSDYIVFRKR